MEPYIATQNPFSDLYFHFAETNMLRFKTDRLAPIAIFQVSNITYVNVLTTGENTRIDLAIGNQSRFWLESLESQAKALMASARYGLIRFTCNFTLNTFQDIVFIHFI